MFLRRKDLQKLMRRQIPFSRNNIEMDFAFLLPFPRCWWSLFVYLFAAMLLP